MLLKTTHLALLNTSASSGFPILRPVPSNGARKTRGAHAEVLLVAIALAQQATTIPLLAVRPARLLLAQLIQRMDIVIFNDSVDIVRFKIAFSDRA